MTINGIGTKFYNVSKPNPQGESNAILWFTFLYFPILPLDQMIIIRNQAEKRWFQYRIVKKTKFNNLEIIKTYFLGWIVLPFITALPLVFSLKEVSDLFGYNNTTFHHILFFVSIFWIVMVIWRLKVLDDSQGLLKN